MIGGNRDGNEEKWKKDRMECLDYCSRLVFWFVKCILVFGNVRYEK